MRAGALAAALAVLSLTACNKPPASIDEAALDQIAEAVEAELNAPGAAIAQMLKGFDSPSPIGLDAMAVSLDQQVVPLDWWLVRHGLVEQVQPSPADHPVFVLNAAGRAIIAAPPAWFTAQADPATAVDCQSAAATQALGCEVDLPVRPDFTAAGRALSAQGSLPLLNIHALVVPTGEGWEVRELRSEGPGLQDVALTALLGPESARKATRAAALAALGLGPETRATPPPVADAAPSAPLAVPIEPVAPVEPELGEPPYAPRPGLRR